MKKGRRKFQPPITKTGKPCKRCTQIGKRCHLHRVHQMRRPQKSRPVKFTETKRRRYLELLEKGAMRCAAAAAVGVHRSTTHRAMRDEPDFASAVEAAEIQANSEVQTALFEAAIGGNVTAQQVWLYNRVSGAWVNSQRREVHRKISDSERVRFAQAAATAGLNESQIETLARALEGADEDTEQ